MHQALSSSLQPSAKENMQQLSKTSLEEPILHGTSKRGFRTRALFVAVLFVLFLFVRINWQTAERPVPSPYIGVPPLDNFILPEIRYDLPQTREYTLVVGETLGSPDGFERPMLVVNGTYPGPTIHANQYDRLLITVINTLPNSRTSIHWHGLFQNSTPFYDGVQGVTQCGIPPGEQMLYNFTLGRYSGTTMYHAHWEMQYSDGVIGALIINPVRNEDAALKVPAWDHDVAVLLQDWYHETTEELLPRYLSPEGVDGVAGDEPVPDSATINGLGRWGDTEQFYNLTVLPHKTYRFRVMNAGSLANIRFSVDNHPLTVVSADGVDVEPIEVSGVVIAIGQRYDVLLRTDHLASEGPWWVRAEMTTEMFTYEQPGQVRDQRAILFYGDSPCMPSTNSTSPDPGPGKPGLSDLDTTQLVPVFAANAPNPTRQYVVNVTLEDNAEGVNMAYMNNITWTPISGTPTLLRLLAADLALPDGISMLRRRQLMLSHNDIQVVDLIVNNFDDAAHPFHLHGHQFWVVGNGPGVYGDSPNSTANFDTKNLMRRDTHIIDGESWMVIRFVADNPGIWTFHCHIAWHMAAGLLMQIVNLPGQIAALEIPQTVLDQCK